MTQYTLTAPQTKSFKNDNKVKSINIQVINVGGNSAMDWDFGIQYTHLPQNSENMYTRWMDATSIIR